MDPSSPCPSIPPSWQRAASMAARFHAGQLRKDEATPYVAHPFRVAMAVRDLFGVDDPAVLCAALLHDLIEDTTADYDDIHEAFGPEVADVVAVLTKDMRMQEADREAAYDEGLQAAPWQAKVIKLADVYDNVCDAATAKLETKALDKARRAMQIAGDDPRLAKAVQVVGSLLG